MALIAGSRLGNYEVAAHIGAGGMGQVYRARDTKLNRDVALKLLPESFAQDADRVARFTREAQTLAALNNPHIAAIYGLEESQGISALVMELVEGEDLSQRIARGPIPVDEALPIAKQIADALEAAHEQGIIHRDLKPANIKVKGDGTVKVLDFGLAKAMEPAVGSSPSVTMSPTITTPAMTAMGVILGTAAYMSPEQARGRRVDKRADIWAFGAVLYEMLTGTSAFTGEDTTELIAAVVKTTPNWAALPSTLPAAILALIQGCLEKDPKARIGDIAVARFLLAGSFAPDRTAATTSLGQSTAPAWTRVLPWTVASAFAVVALALLMLWAPWRSEKPPDRPLVRLDVDLGADASLPPPTSIGPAIAISPDGTRLVYASGTPTKLYIRRLDQPKAVELPGTQGAASPFFSVDGQWVGFMNGGKAHKISVEGGAIVPLDGYPALDGGWGEDGNALLTRDLRRLRAGATAENLLQRASGELDFGAAQVLPGGKAILFMTDAPGPVDKTTIDVITLADGRRKTIIRGGASPRYLATANDAGHLLYVTGSTLFAVPFDPTTLEARGRAVPVLDDVVHENLVGSGQFDVSRAGTLVYRKGAGSAAAMTTLHWVNPAGRTDPLPVRPGDLRDPSVSPDGTRIALSIADGGATDIWVYEPQRDAMTRVTLGRGKVYRGPHWSPDGQYLVFSDVGIGLVQARADGGSQPQPLTQSPMYQIAPSFSPDGKRLAYSESRGTEIWTLPLEEREGQLKAGTPDAFLKAGSGNVAFPSFSPDGRWLAYQSSESGATEVYVRALPAPTSGRGGRWQISSGGEAGAPHWSRSGHDLLYQSGDQIMAVGYSVKGDTFVADKPRVWIAKLGNLAQTVNGLAWDLAPDGQRVLVVAPVESAGAPTPEHEVVFVMNFFDELRRRVPLGR